MKFFLFGFFHFIDFLPTISFICISFIAIKTSLKLYDLICNVDINLSNRDLVGLFRILLI